MLPETEDDYCCQLAGKPWVALAEGLREKSADIGAQRFRLLEFSEPFQEPNWCLKAHTGYVLQGEIVINVAGREVTYQHGDIVRLPAGTQHRHQSTLETATLFLVESVDS